MQTTNALCIGSQKRFSVISSVKTPSPNVAVSTSVWHAVMSKKKTPLMFHILKEHRTTEEVPFYCSLCGYKAFKRDQLERHLHTFPLHWKTKTIQQPAADDRPFFTENPKPVEIENGRDYVEMAREESWNMWTERQRKKPLASTYNTCGACFSCTYNQVDSWAFSMPYINGYVRINLPVPIPGLPAGSFEGKGWPTTSGEHNDAKWPAC